MLNGIGANVNPLATARSSCIAGAGGTTDCPPAIPCPPGAHNGFLAALPWTGAYTPNGVAGRSKLERQAGGRQTGDGGNNQSRNSGFIYGLPRHGSLQFDKFPRLPLTALQFMLGAVERQYHLTFRHVQCVVPNYCIVLLLRQNDWLRKDG